jgi:hypothetical protein
MANPHRQYARATIAHVVAVKWWVGANMVIKPLRREKQRGARKGIEDTPADMHGADKVCLYRFLFGHCA